MTRIGNYSKSKIHKRLEMDVIDGRNIDLKNLNPLQQCLNTKPHTHKTHAVLTFLCLASLASSCTGVPPTAQAQDTLAEASTALKQNNVGTQQESLTEARDIIVLIDRSGSNQAALKEQMGILKELCTKLGENDRINIFSYTYNDKSSFQVGGNNQNNPLASYALNLDKSAAQEFFSNLEEDSNKLTQLLSSIEENKGKSFEDLFETSNRKDAKNIVLVLTDDFKGVNKSGEEVFDESFLDWMKEDKFNTKTQGFAYTPGEATKEYFTSIGFKLIQNKVSEILNDINTSQREEDDSQQVAISENKKPEESGKAENAGNKQEENNLTTQTESQDLQGSQNASSQYTSASTQNGESKGENPEHQKEELLHPLKNTPARNQGKLAKTSDMTNILFPTLTSLVGSLGLGGYAFSRKKSQRTDSKYA